MIDWAYNFELLLKISSYIKLGNSVFEIVGNPIPIILHLYLWTFCFLFPGANLTEIENNFEENNSDLLIIFPNSWGNNWQTLLSKS